MTDYQSKLWDTILNQLQYCMIGSVLRYRIFDLELRIEKLEADSFKVSNR